MENIEQIVRNKITKIQTDQKNSIGLTKKEAQIAVKLGLIDKDQVWYWLEHWQKDERKATNDITEVG